MCYLHCPADTWSPAKPCKVSLLLIWICYSLPEGTSADLGAGAVMVDNCFNPHKSSFIGDKDGAPGRSRATIESPRKPYPHNQKKQCFVDQKIHLSWTHHCVLEGFKGDPTPATHRSPPDPTGREPLLLWISPWTHHQAMHPDDSRHVCRPQSSGRAHLAL